VAQETLFPNRNSPTKKSFSGTGGEMLENLREYVFNKIEIVPDIYLWMDNWHPMGVLVERFGFRIVYDSHSNLEAKLSTVLKDGIWCWRPAQSDDLVEIQSKLSEVQIGVVDNPIWTIAPSGSYVSSAGGLWFGIPILYRSRLFFSGWFLRIGSLLGIDCCLGDLQGTLLVCFAVTALKVENICFLVVVSAPVYGELACKDVISRTHLLIGMICLKKSVELGRLSLCWGSFVVWCLVPLCIKFGELRMIFGMVDSPKQKSRY